MATDVCPWLFWPFRKVQYDMSRICFIVCVFIVVTVGICNIGCISVSIVKNNIPLTVPRGISPPFCCSTADLNITTTVVDAEITAVVRNQGGRSGASAVDFLIQALAKGSGRQGRF